MIDLKQIHDMWAQDCTINNTQLAETSKQTPALHSKCFAYPIANTDTICRKASLLALM